MDPPSPSRDATAPPPWRRFRRYAIAHMSMAPALLPGDYVVAHHTTRIRRGDVVVVPHPARTGLELVKRVVGLPREHIAITAGVLTVDGVVSGPYWAGAAPTGSWTLGREVFVLGDNRSASTEDSLTLGGIPVGSGLWRVVFRYWPPHRIVRSMSQSGTVASPVSPRQADRMPPEDGLAIAGTAERSREEYGGSGMDMVVRKDVAAPPDVVWAIVTDLDRSPDIITGIDEIERLDSGTGFAVGTRWRETRTMFGRAATEEMEVTELDPGRSYTIEADGHNVHYVSTLHLEPIADGTRVTMTFRADPDGLISKVLANTLGRLMIGTTRKALQRDLDDIATAATR